MILNYFEVKGMIFLTPFVPESNVPFFHYFTLFYLFIGRTFEGSYTTMVNSLDKLSELDESTLVWPGENCCLHFFLGGGSGRGDLLWMFKFLQGHNLL